MHTSRFKTILAELRECDNYLEGRAHDKAIAKLAKQAADYAVEDHKDELIRELMEAGLNLEDY